MEQLPQETAPTKKTTGLSFSLALHELKNGFAIGRKGWNGKGMSIYLRKGSSPTIEPRLEHENPLLDGISQKLFELGDAGTVVRLPNLVMVSATGSFFAWTPNTIDVLAEDWEII